MQKQILNVGDLRKSYQRGNNRFPVLKGVSLSIREGEVLAFLGKNGAGKTTTIKIISGLVVPDAGSVTVTGKDIVNDASTLKHVGAVLEGNRNLYWKLTADENLQYFGMLKGMKRKDAKRRSSELLNQLLQKNRRNVPVQVLSRGMQQMVGIATALVHQPRLLLLDEPTLGLDFEAAQAVISLIREVAREGLAVLLTTHQLDIAEKLADRVAMIRDGRVIVEGKTEDVIQHFSSQSYYIKVDGSLNDEQVHGLGELGASVSGNNIIFDGSNSQLYRIIEMLKPLPLLKIEKGGETLSDVFSLFIKEQERDRLIHCGI